MNQQFHVVFDSRNTKEPVSVRLPLPPGEKYNSKRFMSGTHEIRQFLEPLGPYAIASVDTQATAQQLLNEGHVWQPRYGGDGSRWYVCGGFVRDNGAVFVMLPEKISDSEFFKRLNLGVVLPNWAASFKVGKYLKRLFSHHNTYIKGTIVQTEGDVVFAKVPGSDDLLKVRYVTESPLTDGMNLVSSHCVKRLNKGLAEKDKISEAAGTGLRITALSNKGFSKGHAIVIEGLKYDLVLFGSKQLLVGSEFIIAVDELHSGKLFTDAQSVMNFRLYQTPFLQEWSETFMFEVIDALKDEEKLRSMLRFYDIDFHRDKNSGEPIEKEKDWALLRALRSGITITDKPALIRKIFHLFVDKIMDCENDVRIPVPAIKGGARYMMVDPTIFDENGDPTFKGVLSGNQVYYPEHVGPVVFHRQPNAHRGEHHIAHSVNPRQLQAIDRGSFMFISRDVVESVLLKLGGGDQDDRAVIYTDPRVVSHFDALEQYPIVRAGIEQEKPIEKVNRFFSQLVRNTPVYDLEQINLMFAQQERQRVNIGQAVNPIMVDTIITDQKIQIINFLKQLPKEHFGPKEQFALEQMEAFPGNMMKVVASKLESIIDAVKRDGADVSEVATEIKAFWAWLPVVPQFCLTGGMRDENGVGRGRLPQSRRGMNHPVTVITDMDKVLLNIKEARIELEDFVTELSWQLLKEVPLEILTYPALSESMQVARAIRTYYHTQLREKMSKAVSTRDKIDSFMAVDLAVYNQFKNHPLAVDAMIELYGIVYSARQPQAPKDENGRPRAYSDGILWGPYMSGLTMKALEKVELAGKYISANIYNEAKRFKKGTHAVNINAGVVTTQGSNVEIGFTDPLADGMTQIEQGLVKLPIRRVKQIEPTNVEFYQAQQLTFTVVNGWKSKPLAESTPEIIAAWKSHAHEQVNLEPYTYMDEESKELHAVRVVLNGEAYGNLVEEDAVKVTAPTSGWLAPGRTPRTMTVIVKGGK